MVKYSTLLLLAELLVPSFAAVQLKAPPVVPGAFIVEFADTNDASDFYSDLGNVNTDFDHRMNLSFSLFKGASFQLRSGSNEQAAAQKIAELPSVKQIWPVRLFKIPEYQVLWTGNEASLPSSPVLQKRQSSAPDTFSPHVMTQVDKLHAEGVTGEGVRIAVIDTGVDYTHPALGGCFGPGCLVAFGTDLVGDNYTGLNTPVPDPDPFDGCVGHGTHVSGIIAAQTNPFNFTGAAPGVTLGMYRVFGCTGSAANDVLIAAYMMAHQDGADIITASIGGSSGWTEDPWAVAVQRIVEAGVPCTVSAGNDGAEGLFFASTAANGKKVTAIASVDNIETPMVLVTASFTTDNTTTETFGWAQGQPAAFGNISLPLFAIDFNTSNPADGCDPFPDDTPDLSGFLVLIRRGTCTFVQKATNAAAKGAHFIMLYNNVPGAIAVDADVDGIEGIGMVTPELGAEWISLLSNGSDVVVNIIDPLVAPIIVDTTPNTLTGGFLSTFTSWGPTFEVDIKPQVAAPGGIILSTFPQDLGSYAVLSGTSMACPITAGIIALMSKVRGTLDPATMENLLSANANPNVFQDGVTAADFLAPVAQQGGGLVQAFDAAHAVTLLSVSSISFNDTDHFVRRANFSIQNTGTEAVTYDVGQVAAATGYTLGDGSIFPDLFPSELVVAPATLSFSASTLTVQAGETETVFVTLAPPEGLDATRLPVYSGYITLNATSGESLSLPYLGVVGSIFGATVLDVGFLSNSSDANLDPVPANSSFVLPSPGTADADSVLPAIVISLAMGSSIVRVDVVPSSHSHHSNVTTVLGLKTLGNIFEFPSFYNPRLAFAATWDGQLEDGTFAPAGDYTLVVGALHIFGNPNKAADYDFSASVPFSISYE